MKGQCRAGKEECPAKRGQLISTKALAVGQEKSYRVYIGQGDFENDCTSGFLMRHSSNPPKMILANDHIHRQDGPPTSTIH